MSYPVTAKRHNYQAVGEGRNAPRPPTSIRSSFRSQLGSPRSLSGVDNSRSRLYRIATIFPFVLLCVLGATFYISSRLPHSVTISNCNIMGGSTSGRPGTDESGTGESVQASATTHTVPTRSFDRAKSRRSFDVRKPGPEGHLDLDQVGSLR